MCRAEALPHERLYGRCGRRFSPTRGDFTDACGAGLQRRTWRLYGALWGRASSLHVATVRTPVGQGFSPARGDCTDACGAELQPCTWRLTDACGVRASP